MNISLSDRVRGLLFGSFSADALALGAHWIYDQAELERDFGRVTDFLQPRADSYHLGKRSGEQTHYGDQALTLLNSIEAHLGYDAEKFAEAWAVMWTGYGDYFDHATKDTLANLAAGKPWSSAASDSDELGGAARIAPLLACLTAQDVEETIAAARSQTSLTHGAPIAGDAAEFLARIVFHLLHGSDLSTSLHAAATGNYAEFDFVATIERISALKDQPLAAAARALGLACPAPKALPTLILLLQRHGENLETALIENVMIGGDNAARGLALGMILGAYHGQQAIPDRWKAGLVTASRLNEFLARLEQRQ